MRATGVVVGSTGFGTRSSALFGSKGSSPARSKDALMLFGVIALPHAKQASPGMCHLVSAVVGLRLTNLSRNRR